MARMSHPHLGSVIDVRKDSVQRYTDAGYVEVKSETKSTAKKSSSSKTKK